MATEFDIKFEFDIDGVESWSIDAIFVKKIFMSIYNTAADLFNEGGVEEYNKAFERYFPDEFGGNDTCDNAYVELYLKGFKELSDKISKMIGLLPSGRHLYLDEEPITINADMKTGFCNGYAK